MMGRPPKIWSEPGPITLTTPFATNIRLRSLELAVESMKPATVTGSTENILNRANSFARWLSGEADTRRD